MNTENEEQTDLFEDIENLPNEVKEVLNKYCYMDNDYESCQALVNDLEATGYTCDYYLNAEPYNLRKL